MQKRGMIFDTYDTAARGWTLTPGWKLSPAEQKTKFVDKPNGDGAWDLSTALSDGVPRYNDRNLTAIFECSDGDRLTRETKIREWINLLDGMRVKITLPDDQDRYIIGRLHIAKEYNDLAHAAVKVTAVCEPWKYSKEETIVRLTASTSEQSKVLSNNGRKVLLPTLEVTGTNAAFKIIQHLSTHSLAVTLSAGTYTRPDLLIPPGDKVINYLGTGVLAITYREAVLE